MSLGAGACDGFAADGDADSIMTSIWPIRTLGDAGGFPGDRSGCCEERVSPPGGIASG